MNATRYLIAMMLVVSVGRAAANSIDSLATGDDVRQFLSRHFGTAGFTFLNVVSMLPRTGIWTYYSARPDTLIDTIMVEDPVSGKYVTKVSVRVADSAYYSCGNFSRPRSYPFDYVSRTMDKFPLNFYKTDIDGNGLTDMVVDAGIIVIVMDMGDRFEGHLISDRADWGSYSFKQFTSLPEGNRAMLLRHDHNPCPRDAAQMTGVNLSFDSGLYNLTDTIVFKFGGFAKYNSHYRPAGISKIKYHYRSTFDVSCLAGEDCIEIKKNGECSLQHPLWKAYLKGKLDSSSVCLLMELVAYLDVKSMKERYVCWTDHSSGAAFLVYFDDGSEKRIYTWDYCPVLELGYLSRFISGISSTIKWLPSDRHADIECHPWAMDDGGALFPSCECR